MIANLCQRALVNQVARRCKGSLTCQVLTDIITSQLSMDKMTMRVTETRPGPSSNMGGGGGGQL